MEDVPLKEDLERGCFHIREIATVCRTLGEVIKHLHNERRIIVGNSKIVCWWRGSGGVGF